MQKIFEELTDQEVKIFQSFNSPRKIQDFLETIPINFEKGGETCYSPRKVLENNKAHCFEGALFAAAALMFHREKPLLLDLVSAHNDYDHVVALFRDRGCWGAISKTNHGVLRYREPIYKNIREIALSYFHEYFLDSGQKTLRTFSKPFNLSRFNSQGWVTARKDLWYLVEALDNSPHQTILNKSQIRKLRPADPIEIKIGKVIEWIPGKKSYKFK